MKTVIYSLFLVLLVGCSSILLKEPFPDSEMTEQERNELRGTWQIDKDVLYVEFTTNSVPWLSVVEWEDNQFQLNKHRLHFTKKNDALYVSTSTEPNGQQSNFFFAEINPRGQDIVLWLPDLDFFEKQIQTGTLNGTVRGGTNPKEIVLDTPATELLELIATNSDAINYKDPLIIKKVD